LLWLVPLDRHDQLFLQVDSLSFHLVQKSPVTSAGGPRHHLRHGRAFPGEQKPVLIFEALQPAPRYVVLDVRRGLVRLWFSCRTFSHLVSLSRANPVGAPMNADERR
jgi:hypothetical protein